MLDDMDERNSEADMTPRYVYACGYVGYGIQGVCVCLFSVRVCVCVCMGMYAPMVYGRLCT
ncbi:hypothetical protein EON63_14675 [archaeon]|nr:MAG: hypothetical protein EON63_14675 [archaeon]